MKRLIRYKIYFQRSLIYVSIINAFMIFAIFIKTMGLPVWAIPIGIIFGAGLLFLVGYLDHRFVLEKENEILFNKTPQIKELLNK